MTTEIQTQNPDRSAERALVVSSRIEIRDVVLVTAKLVRSNVAEGRGLNVYIQRIARAIPDPSAKLLRVQVTMNFSAREPDGDKKPPPVEVEASYELTYHLADRSDLTQDDFEAFAQMNGMFNAWPYFREFLQSSLTRMGLPSFTIPVLRVQLAPAPRKRSGEPQPDRKPNL